MESKPTGNTLLLEILETADGEVVLRPAGGEGEILLTIRFSPQARAWVGDKRLLVAKAMIEAGIQASARLGGEEAELDYPGSQDPAGRSLH